MAAGIRNIRRALQNGTGCGSCFGTSSPTREKPPEDFPRRAKGPLESEKPGEDAARRLLENFEW